MVETIAAFAIFNCMNSRTLRLLIREILLREASTPTAAPAKPAPQPASGGVALKTKLISPYHARALSQANFLRDDYAKELAEVGGVVKTYSNGRLINTSAAPTNLALASVTNIDQATAKMEKTLRDAIKNNALIYKDPKTWRANILAKKGADGKPYLPNDESAQHLEAYEKAEIDALPIMFIIASPDAPKASREQAFARCLGRDGASGVYAFYRRPAGVYVVNLVTDQGLRTLKPAVLSNRTDKPASQASKSKILASLKSAFSNPAADGFVAAHEFGHAESAFLTHFFNELAGLRRSDSKFSTAASDEDTLSASRLTDLKAAIEINSSDLIAAQNDEEINSAVSNHDPSLPQGSTVFFRRVFEYATILSSLGINAPITSIFPVESAKKTSNSFADGREFFELGPITLSAPSKEFLVQWSNTQNLDAFSAEHLAVTLKMLQQHAQTLGDVGLAIQNLSKGSVSAEEARRAKIILQLAGAGGLRNAVMKFAANDAVQKSPGAAAQPATSATA